MLQFILRQLCPLTIFFRPGHCLIGVASHLPEMANWSILQTLSPLFGFLSLRRSGVSSKKIWVFCIPKLCFTVTFYRSAGFQSAHLCSLNISELYMPFTQHILLTWSLLAQSSLVYHLYPLTTIVHRQVKTISRAIEKMVRTYGQARRPVH